MVYTEVENKIDRDERYKQILHQQLGENGITLIVYVAFLFILALIMVIAAIIGFISSQPPETLNLKMPAIVTLGSG